MVAIVALMLMLIIVVVIRKNYTNISPKPTK